MNTIVPGTETIDSAADALENIFRSILNHHAPMKTFNMRRNYKSSYIKGYKGPEKEYECTRTRTKCSILKKELSILCKEVKKAIAKDEKEFFESGFGDDMDSTKAWRTANELLGTVKNLSPTAIIHKKDDDESPEMVTNP